MYVTAIAGPHTQEIPEKATTCPEDSVAEIFHPRP